MANKKPKPWTKATEDKFLSQMGVLVIAWLMEQPEFANDEERLIDFYDSMFKWWGAIHGNELSVMRAAMLVKRHTGKNVFF